MKPKSVPSQQPQPKKNTLQEIERLKKEREERRRIMESIKQDRLAEEQRNRENNTPGDIDFMRMIRSYRAEQAPPQLPHILPSEQSKITICVRKRPINSKEIKKHDYDSVSCINPLVIVHDCKLKVDGISKYLDNTNFEFDHTFDENDTSEDIYSYAVQPLVEFVLNGGRATVFAYGQTGSGKTFTMQGIQSLVVNDLYSFLSSYEALLKKNIKVYVSYFEIYGGRCQDLLNSRNRLNVREDGSGDVVVSDLMELEALSAENLQSIIETGNRNRTTHATESNDESSRSHAICQIALKTQGPKEEVLLGRFSLIDLAGSERGADTKSHNRQRRMEGAEINKSLLALKECIRALDSGSTHVPYRASKLTLVLKDSFTNKKSKTVMITTISPAASSADHTINTLRYADRIKEKVVGAQAALKGQGAVPSAPPSQPAAGNYQSEEAKRAQQANYNNNNLRGNPIAEPKAPIRQAPSSKMDYKGANDDYNNYNNNHRGNGGGNYYEEDDEDVMEFHKTIESIYQEEEVLLNLHMSIIQENAELLTEEGRLLQLIQNENYDLDLYSNRLNEILNRKQELIINLKEKLDSFRKNLMKEENYSKQIANRF